MKKLLMVILMASILSPAFAYADEKKSDKKGENSSRKSAQMIQKNEKKEIKKERKEEKREYKKERKEEHREEKKEVKKAKAKKINYFFCVTATDWKVVPVEAYKDNNSNNYLGEDCVKLPSSIAKRLQSVMGTATTTATTTLDTIAPAISLLTSSSVNPTSATITWTTDELANGNVYLSTVNPVATTSTPIVGTTTLSTSHTLNLTALLPNTTYYYVVKSADAAGNVVTGMQMSFVTPAVAPIISGAVTSLVASTTATISWNTDILATSKLYFGTSTPLTLFASTTVPSMVHTFNLTGLTASTTYSILLESKGNANNITTSSSSFSTTAI